MAKNIPSARHWMRKEDIEYLRTLKAKLEVVQDEQQALRKKMEELDAKHRQDAERVARERQQRVSALVGGEPVLDIPVVESSTDLLREAKAQIQKRLAQALENESEIRARYRAALFDSVQRAVLLVYDEYVTAAKKAQECLTLALGLNAFAAQYSGKETFNPAAARQAYLPAFDQLRPAARLCYSRPTLLLGEELEPNPLEVMGLLEQELESLVGPEVGRFWAKPAEPERLWSPSR